MGVKKVGDHYVMDYRYQGKRIRETVRLEGISPDKVTKRQAEAAYDVIRADIATGRSDILAARKRVPFELAVEEFLEKHSKPNKKSYRRDVVASKPLLKFFAGKYLSHINPTQFEEYRKHRLKTPSIYGRPISKTTINRETAFLKTMLNYAIKRRWLNENPLKGFKLYKEKQGKMRILKKREFKKLYDAASDHLRPILVTAYCTGMRKNEILTLKWENVDMEKGFILVEETKNDENKIIPINKLLQETLNSVKYSSPKENVFTFKGKPIQDTKTAFNAALRRSGIDKCVFHDLRHTFASNLVMNGVDIKTVQELLGHKSIMMTMRYSHPTPDHKKQAVNSLDVDLSGHFMDTSKGNTNFEGSSNTEKH